MPNEPNERIKRLQAVSTLPPHELDLRYNSESLPVLRQIKHMKKSLIYENALPSTEQLPGETVYRSMRESCICLNNNKRIHDDVEMEMLNNYKVKLNKFIKESSPGIWK